MDVAFCGPGDVLRVRMAVPVQCHTDSLRARRRFAATTNPTDSFAPSPTPVETAREWLREMWLESGGQYPEFIAAVSILFVLPPVEARDLLEERVERLAAQLAEAETSSAPIRDFPGCSSWRRIIGAPCCKPSWPG
jgi:hypothetical protein